MIIVIITIHKKILDRDLKSVDDGQKRLNVRGADALLPLMDNLSVAGRTELSGETLQGKPLGQAELAYGVSMKALHRTTLHC